MERPIIRQAVAFSADPPTQVPVATYEANVTKPKKPHFLPGQEVPLPSKSKVSKRNKTGIKRPRRPDAYPGQTTRFRLETYDPTPTTDPPIAHGSGPYSSMYRGVAPSVPVQTQGGPGMHHDSVMAPSALPSGVYQAGSRDASSSGTYTREGPNISVSPAEPTSMPTSNGPPPPPPAMAQQTHTSSSRDHDPPSLQNHPAQSQASSQHDSSSSPPTRSVTGHSTFVTDTSLALRERSSPGPYYRRNYDDKEFVIPRESRNISPSDSAPKSSFDNFCTFVNYCNLSSTVYICRIAAQNRNFTRPAYRVTVLIDDLRQSSDPDHQLAEVKVPLKRCDDPEDGWWADAKDIVGIMLLNPCRVGSSSLVIRLSSFKQAPPE